MSYLEFERARKARKAWPRWKRWAWVAGATLLVLGFWLLSNLILALTHSG